MPACPWHLRFHEPPPASSPCWRPCQNRLPRLQRALITQRQGCAGCSWCLNACMQINSVEASDLTTGLLRIVHIMLGKTHDSSYMVHLTSSRGPQALRKARQPALQRMLNKAAQCTHWHQQGHRPWRHGRGHPHAGPDRARCGWTAVVGPRHCLLPLQPWSVPPSAQLPSSSGRVDSRQSVQLFLGGSAKVS